MKKPGRPPLDPTARAPSADVHLRLAAVDYDLADKHARLKRETIQDMLRRALKRLIQDERG